VFIQTGSIQFGPAEFEEVFGKIHTEGVLLHTMSGSHYVFDNSSSHVSASTSAAAAAISVFRSSSSFEN
jgi:hypothetical protein